MKVNKISITLLLIIQVSLISCSEGTNKKNDRLLETKPASNVRSLKRSSPDNFVDASRAVTPAIVHIKTSYIAQQTPDLIEQLYGLPSRGTVPSTGSGSGVTISEDGYIATNNHVVENATSIEVIFPDRSAFPAKLIGTDPTTDLALLKVDARDLPVVKAGNSDDVEVGEWVLAIGYPFSLNTTVTAGIISAKGRSIGIINRSGNLNRGETGNTAIESFLQTDAAINPGNSGGALVNTAGELIGINTAIASQTGSYAGYAFAIPVNLASKVLDDLKKYGAVRRAILGVSYPSPIVEDAYLRQQGINPATVKGVYILNVQSGSAAASAGLKQGDIIQNINGEQITSSAEFSERIARLRPGDEIKLDFLRNGKSNTATVKLRGEETTSGSQTLEEIYNKLGATFVPLTDEIKQQFKINSGLVVAEVRAGGFFDQIGIPRGTIIVYINGKPVNTPEDINHALLSAQRGIIQILGIAPDGSRVAFNLSLGT